MSAKFEPAFSITNGNEGLFANNPHDIGKMTYRGIASSFHPKWEGWRYVRNCLAGLAIQPPYGTKAYKVWVKVVNARLQAIPALQELVKSFYKVNFWDAYRLSELDSQVVANWIYDHVVNAGGRGAKWAQLAAKVTPDGAIGPKSIAAINGMKPILFISRASDIAGAHRLDVAHNTPSQIQFLTGWLNRDGQPPNIIAMVRAAAKDGRLDEKEVTEIKSAMEATA